MFSFSQCSPEDAGVPSAALSKMLGALQQKQIPVHSLLLLRQGKLFLEAYYAPYTATTLHRTFSITKSFVSIAVGCLEADGLIQLDDSIVDYFPEFLPKQVHPWLAQTTIRNMLSMRSCHSAATYKFVGGGHWVESFFTVAPSNPPGRVFHYDTSASHVLAALVEKLTGKNLLDYLREKCLNQLDFSTDAYILQDPYGCTMGGSGLMATPLDILKFGYLMAENGCINARQLVSAEYIRQATSYQCSTATVSQNDYEGQGYGYQFWMLKNGYACFGMGGQYAIVLPEYDIVMAITADTQNIKGGNQLLLDTIFETLLPVCQNQPLPQNAAAYQALAAQVAALQIQPVAALQIQPVAALHPAPVAFSNATAYTLAGNGAGITSLSIAINSTADAGYFSYTRENTSYKMDFGIGRQQLFVLQPHGHNAVASAGWQADGTLILQCHIIDTSIGSLLFQFSFVENNVVVYCQSVEETMYKEFCHLHLYGELE